MSKNFCETLLMNKQMLVSFGRDQHISYLESFFQNITYKKGKKNFNPLQLFLHEVLNSPT